MRKLFLILLVFTSSNSFAIYSDGTTDFTKDGVLIISQIIKGLMG